MPKENVIKEKTFDFALTIIELYKYANLRMNLSFQNSF